MDRRLVALLAALAAAAAYLLLRPAATVGATAYFDSAVGLYPGSDVRVLGVRIGQVTEVAPAGGKVRVELAYDADRRVPASAQAVIVARSVIADRYLQLTPPYTGGPALADGATLRDTRSPVEIDTALSGFSQLAAALGPRGAEEEGALSRLLRVSADTFGGQGETVGATVRGLSDAASALAAGGDDTSRTVRHLAVITGAMARDDARIRMFMRDLAGVSEQLDGEREELRAVLKGLSGTLTQVADFVEDNRGEVAAGTRDLAHLTELLVRQRASIEAFLDVAPLGLNNAGNAYDATSGTFCARLDLNGQTDDLARWLCSLLHDATEDGCESLLGPLNPAGRAAGKGAIDTSWLLPDVHVDRPDLTLGGLLRP
ncbi:MCE family protein [Nonomuraea sp. NPDC002799]